MISLTPAAAEQILVAQEQGDNAGLALRIAARLDDDGRIEFGMGFDEERERDLAFASQGVELLVGASSQALLEGVTIDFVEYEAGEYRFIFIPPESACEAPAQSPGCGSGGCSRCGGS